MIETRTAGSASPRGADLQMYGPAAQAFGAMLPPCAAVVTDPAGAVFALAAAVERRSLAEPFFASILLLDPFAALAWAVAPILIEQNSGYDERRSALDQVATGNIGINGQPIRQASLYDDPTLKTLRDFLLTSDALLARSHAERRRIEATLGRGRAFSGIFPGVDARVPKVRWTGGRSIVVWAPDADARDLSLIAFALAELHAPVVLVCAGGKPAGSAARVIGLAGAEEALLDAQVVIDASHSAPSAAIALAQLGIPLAVASTSGADEFIDGANVYDPWNWQSILAAVSKARAGRTVVKHTGMNEAALRKVLEETFSPVDERTAPLVSIIIPTYNRPAMLDQQLARLGNQRYKNIEVIVVNDGGSPLDDIVARYPNARLIDCETNGGCARATNLGVKAARGEYVCTLPDDDAYYADHIARLASVASATGAKIIHANVIYRLLEKAAGDDDFALYGHLLHYDGHLDMSITLGVVNISVLGMFFARSLFDTQDFYDETIPLTADSELVMRLSRAHDFVHVDHITAESVYRHAGGAQSSQNPEQLLLEVQAVFDRYPAPGRQWLADLRARSLSGLKNMFVARAGIQPAIRLPR